MEGRGPVEVQISEPMRAMKEGLSDSRWTLGVSVRSGGGEEGEWEPQVRSLPDSSSEIIEFPSR